MHILPLLVSSDLLITPSAFDILRQLFTVKFPKSATKAEVLWKLIGSMIIGEGACSSKSSLVAIVFSRSSNFKKIIIKYQQRVINDLHKSLSNESINQKYSTNLFIFQY